MKYYYLVNTTSKKPVMNQLSIEIDGKKEKYDVYCGEWENIRGSIQGRSGITSSSVENIAALKIFFDEDIKVYFSSANKVESVELKAKKNGKAPIPFKSFKFGSVSIEFSGNKITNLSIDRKKIKPSSAKAEKNENEHDCHRVSISWIIRQMEATLVTQDYREITKQISLIQEEAEDTETCSQQEFAEKLHRFVRLISENVNNKFDDDAIGNMAKGWLFAELCKYKGKYEDSSIDKSSKIVTRIPIPKDYRGYFSENTDLFSEDENTPYIFENKKMGDVFKITSYKDFLGLLQLSVIDDNTFHDDQLHKKKLTPETQYINYVISLFGAKGIDSPPFPLAKIKNASAS
jgi:hypothetical protein